MDRIITLKLPYSFVGQILDVLRTEQDAWVYTRSYLLGGPLDIERLIKAHSTATEAGKMVDYYQDIIDAVERQY
jgi:hypothetical protein